MKKTVFFGLLMGLLMFAQAQSPVAILTHNATTTPYYGTNALVDAYNASTPGDVITLSPGVFNVCDIRKAVTIRGAGMMSDTNTGTIRTTLNGNFQLHNTDSTGLYLTLEGLYLDGTTYMDTVYNLNFSKCFINKFVNPSHSSAGVTNGTFIHCIIREIRTAWLYNCHVYNSVLRETNGSGADLRSSDGTLVCDHSIIQLNADDCVTHFHSTNSILLLEDHTEEMEVVNSCLNHEYCIGIHTSWFFVPSSYMAGRHLYNWAWPWQVFVNFDRDVNTVSDYHLNLDTDGMSATLSSDNTQIGIYGGAMPFNPRVINPSIGLITVGGQTDVNGQLPVQIQVVNE